MENDSLIKYIFVSENDHLHILPEKAKFFTIENTGGLGYRHVIGRLGEKAANLIGWLGCVIERNSNE